MKNWNDIFKFKGLNIWGFTILLCLPFALLAQGPTITSFSPDSGPVGTSVTIQGTNFDTSPSNNTVYFGSVKAAVSSATNTSLTVVVPSGANYAPITVLVNGLIAYSAEPFVATFSGEAALDAKTNFTAGNTPTSVAVGDLDNDGFTDMVIANKNSYDISVFRNSSTGAGMINFDAAVNYSTGANSKPQSIAIGDLDNDGRLDVAIANLKANSVSVFRNNSVNGSGVISFDTKVDFTTASKPKAVAIGDLDSDGLADLVFATQGGKTVSILRNTSTGSGNISFDTMQDLTKPGSQLQSVVVADFDGDTKPDLAVAGSSSDFMVIYKNTSTGSGSISFANPISLTAGPSPSWIASGDLDDDGLLDLVVTNKGNRTISLYRNSSMSGAISFGGRVTYSVNSNPSYVAISDLTGDGKLDLAIGYDSSSVGWVSMLENKSTSSGNMSYTFALYTTGAIPKSIAIGDLDNDGKVDLVAGDAGDNTVSVLKN